MLFTQFPLFVCDKLLPFLHLEILQMQFYEQIFIVCSLSVEKNGAKFAFPFWNTLYSVSHHRFHATHRMNVCQGCGWLQQ
jgi:hypothetical protein